MEYTGVKIFKNSFSSHIKDEYRALISYGIPAEEVEELILTHYREFQDGLYRGPFWLGLARAETDTGRLSQRVKEEALAVMTDGSDLELWKLGLELEPDCREAKRRDSMKSARAKAMKEIIQTGQAVKQKEYEQTSDEVRRAQIRTEQVYFSFAVDKLREHAAKEQVPKPKRIPPPPPNDGWEPSPLLDWVEDWKYLCERAFGIQDDSLSPRLPDEKIRKTLLAEIMGLDGPMEKKLKRRIEEHEALRVDMDRPQVPKKVSKPYAAPSPWEEGDVFWMQLKDLDGELAPWNGCYVAYRVIALRRGPSVSVIRPDLACTDDISLGLYRWMGAHPPTVEELEQAGYTSWGSFMTVEQKGLWLSLYGALRTVKKWNWKVIGHSPGFSQALPLFFRDGALKSMMILFGRQLAWKTAQRLSEEGLVPE